MDTKKDKVILILLTLIAIGFFYYMGKEFGRAWYVMGLILFLVYIFILLVVLNERKRKREWGPASELYERFRYSENGAQMRSAAQEIESHFKNCWRQIPADKIGEQLLELMRPLRVGPVPEGIHVLPRPETPEWIALLLVTELDSPYYYEYFTTLTQFYDYEGPRSIVWIRPLLKELLPSIKPEHIKSHRNTLEYLGIFISD